MASISPLIKMTTKAVAEWEKIPEPEENKRQNNTEDLHWDKMSVCPKRTIHRKKCKLIVE